VTLHPHVAGLLPTLDPGWRRKIFRAGLVLCIPVVGWPAVLGYRGRFVRHLFGPTTAALPDWSEGLFGFVREGLARTARSKRSCRATSPIYAPSYARSSIRLCEPASRAPTSCSRYAASWSRTSAGSSIAAPAASARGCSPRTWAWDVSLGVVLAGPMATTSRCNPP
jgi:hypothetical protein